MFLGGREKKEGCNLYTSGRYIIANLNYSVTWSIYENSDPLYIYNPSILSYSIYIYSRLE
jgi:hypothetical protein